IANQRRVGPRLIRGMRDLSPRAVDHGHDDGILPGRLDLRPLLELDDHRVLVSVGIAAREDEVDALRSEGNLVLDGHTCVLRDAVTHEDVVHVLHRVLPGLDLPLGRGVPQPSLEGSENLAFDDVSEYVFGKLTACGGVDNHCFVCNGRFLGLESDQDARMRSTFTVTLIRAVTCPPVIPRPRPASARTQPPPRSESRTDAPSCPSPTTCSDPPQPAGRASS